MLSEIQILSTSEKARHRVELVLVASVMKRVREPFAVAGSPNSPLPSSSAEKRGRQDQHHQHQQHQGQDHHDDDDDYDGQQHQQQHQERPFQALLSEHGVVWPSPATMAAEERQKRVVGFSCRCSNPSKLRLAIERALVNDGARRSEFVEVGVHTSHRLRFQVV